MRSESRVAISKTVTDLKIKLSQVLNDYSVIVSLSMRLRHQSIVTC